MLLPFSLFCAPLQAERRYESRLQDLRDRLEQSESTNRSMQNYVQFLKSSYDNVFRESAFLGSPSHTRSLLWGQYFTWTFFKHTEGALFQKPYWYRKLDSISGSLLGDFFHAEWENKIMLVSVQNVRYQQYQFGAKGWCYTMNWTPKPGGFVYNGKDPFPPVRSWWFQLLKPVRGLLSVLIFVRTLFVLHFSFSFSVGEIMWGLFTCGIFKIILYTVGLMLKITEVPGLYHSHERISCTTTVFVTILYQKLWVWCGFLYLILTYSLILTFICECDTDIALLFLPWFFHLEYTHPGLSQNSLNLKEITVTSFGILVQMPCEFWVYMKSWLCLKPAKEKLQIFNFIKFPAPSGKSGLLCVKSLKSTCSLVACCFY